MNPELNSRVETRDVHRKYVMIAMSSFVVLLMLGVTSAWLLFRHQLKAQLASAAGYSTATFPLPQLQPSPPALLATLHAQEDKALHAYSWVDGQHQIARIPIERAMQLAAKKNLIPSQRSSSNAP